MPHTPPPPLSKPPRGAALSPLILSDRLLTLAEQADQAGYEDAARRLLTLAQRMLARPRFKVAKPPAPPASARPPRYRPRAAAPSRDH